jgi:hypothetical protein
MSTNGGTFIKICESLFFIPLYPYREIYVKNDFFTSSYFMKLADGG